MYSIRQMPARAVILCVSLLALTCSCGPRTRTAPKSSTSFDDDPGCCSKYVSHRDLVAREELDHLSEEVIRKAQIRGRRMLGSDICRVLDQRLGTGWALVRREVVDGSHFITLRPDALRDPMAGIAVLGPDLSPVLIVDNVAGGPRLEGMHDLDGDDNPEALVSTWSGGAHCCITCYYLRLGSSPRLLGGFYGRNSDCGEAKDLDGDKRLEMVTEDDVFAYFDSSFGASPRLPFIYGYRNGRFVDRTRELYSAELLRISEQARADALMEKRTNTMFFPTRLVVEWYGAAELAGHGDRALREMKSILPPRRWNSFRRDLPRIRELLAERGRRIWTGAPPPNLDY